MLTYPVGLITIDEVAYAGGVYGSANQNYYLYTGASYRIMSPSVFSTSNVLATVFIVYTDGGLTGARTSYSYGIRPVINLKSDVLYVDGNGTEADPYIITIQ